jgi:ketosteroid isomerase-like protein
MTDHPNLVAARAGYEAFASGDMAALGELLADDVIWHVGGDNELTGDYLGKQAVFRLFGRLVQEAGFRNEVHDILANDSHGVALVTTYATRNGETMSDRAVQVFHMSDGKLTEFWTFPENARVIDQIWA